MSAGPGSHSGSQDPGGGANSTIGARLRAARKQCNLGIEQVARELHLDTAIIEALEDDNQTALPAPIFVQGYLRSYARLVGLPVDEMVRSYGEQGVQPPPLAVVGSSRRSPRYHLFAARHLRNVILVILAAILIWMTYPLVERFIVERTDTGDDRVPGQLELPPAIDTTQPFQ
ncbi:MAG: helix-turn-helix domain-containing protein [Gammaproteobacteria bacterium]|nr:helix-turn-helix domain-containing protein [Gammaproteobacteria bacterium]